MAQSIRPSGQIQYTSEWLPESRYYGDKYPRSVQEAFGPYAELHVDRRTPGDKIITLAVAICIALLVGAISWAVQ